MSAPHPHASSEPSDVARATWPLSLTVYELGGMLNFELADDPVYDGGELQWFDDEAHGRGMLAFLSRRADRRVDYYPQRGLRLDRSGYQIGGGTGAWTDTDFDDARFEVADDGVDAEVRFTDVDGRVIDVRVDDRDGRQRRRAGLLAPVGAGIDQPTSLLLVWMPGFDLVRVTGTPPVVRIDGRDTTTGRLPGAWLHRRHLVKYAAPVVTVALNRTLHGSLRATVPAGRAELTGDPSRCASITAERAGHRARVVLDPAMPDVTTLADGDAEEGRWHVGVDGVRLTGGRWSVTRVRDRADIGLEVDERWQPERLPWLMRLVTTAVPVFRRWPTTYRWRAQVQLEPTLSIASRWERTASDEGQSYRRATGS
jgi:hypothetical protein